MKTVLVKCPYGGRVRPYFRRRRVRSYYGIRLKGRGRGAAE